MIEHEALPNGEHRRALDIVKDAELLKLLSQQTYRMP